MYRIEFYVPESHLEIVKQAIFLTGAGQFGDYKNCCWQTKGQGQFLPGDQSHPVIGKPGQVEYVEEYKVEVVCDESLIKNVVAELKRTHPYEEPAFGVFEVLDF